jgi:hypothetical protein
MEQDVQKVLTLFYDFCHIQSFGCAMQPVKAAVAKPSTNNVVTAPWAQTHQRRWQQRCSTV